ncbi:MAG: tRNA (adenosine(37)-N6)-threonylcarbamoyltransferase complex dimerization subunit type 1 TsaB [Gemmatimonadota bacterium]|nr:tRNA (adenosine(37)-N6)-threonylcarbamoyltransferase complex dimerization subunit type 1 TsaB [Gemmatimonadota bacterium]
MAAIIPSDAAAVPLEGVILALETSGVVGSVAVASEGDVVARRFLTSPGRTASDLIPSVEALMEEAGLPLQSLTAILAGAGPGSFTGVRIAAATAKGLASALDIPLLAGSSLAAAAVAVEALRSVSELPEAWVPRGPGGAWGGGPFEEERHPRYVLFDARRGRVYGACFAVGGGDPPSVIVEPHGGTVVDVLNGRPPLGAQFMGDGARVHEGLIRAAGFAVQPLPAGVATADGLLAWGSAHSVDGKVWEPDYVRSWTPGR